jgi:hypothetical protein
LAYSKPEPSGLIFSRKASDSTGDVAQIADGSVPLMPAPTGLKVPIRSQESTRSELRNTPAGDKDP